MHSTPEGGQETLSPLGAWAWHCRKVLGSLVGRKTQMTPGKVIQKLSQPPVPTDMTAAPLGLGVQTHCHAPRCSHSWIKGGGTTWAGTKWLRRPRLSCVPQHTMPICSRGYLEPKGYRWGHCRDHLEGSSLALPCCRGTHRQSTICATENSAFSKELAGGLCHLLRVHKWHRHPHQRVSCCPCNRCHAHTP